MMSYETYFRKTNSIYGVSSKFEFGKWNHSVTKFTNLEEAKTWLETEQYDFRERELCSKSRAIELAGKEAVDSVSGWGGAREGAGRPATGRKLRRLYITDDEYQKIVDYLNTLRAN